LPLALKLDMMAALLHGYLYKVFVYLIVSELAEAR